MAPELHLAARARRLSLVAAGIFLIVRARPTPPGDSEAYDPPAACTQASGQIITLQLPSTVYQRLIATSVYLPPCYDWIVAPLPAIYLLHGANTDQTQWPDVGVQTAADALIAE